MNTKVLPAVTTITPGGWKSKIAEIDNLGILEASLFLTVTNATERAELFLLLEKTKLQSAPFVHLRSDMSPYELDYLIERWGTKVFNILSSDEYPLKYDLSKYADRIYVEENILWPWKESVIKQWAGLCVDFAHLEEARLTNPDMYDDWIGFMEKYPIGCAHFSAIMPELVFDNNSGKLRHDLHRLSDLSEMDYLKNYPRDFFPAYAAIELENPLSEQVKIRDYVAKIL